MTKPRVAPKAPPCFSTPHQWSEYLSQAQQHKRDARRPFNGNGDYRPEFNFCGDCTTGHSGDMKAAGRCQPDVLRVIPIKEIA